MLTMNSTAANKNKNYVRIWVCFGAYLFLLFYVLFFAEQFGRTNAPEGYQFNVRLFREIGRFIRLGLERGNWQPFWINVVGNILVFIPFGYGIPFLFRKCRNVMLVTLLTFQFSMTVELIQLISKVGSFDVDDLLLNTLGGVIGGLMARRKNYKFTERSQSLKAIISFVFAVCLVVLYVIFISRSFRENGNVSPYYGGIGVGALVVSVVLLILSITSFFEENKFKLFSWMSFGASLAATICWVGTYIMGLMK